MQAPKKVLIAGASLAGAKAAETLREAVFVHEAGFYDQKSIELRTHTRGHGVLGPSTRHR